jgi:hypothetical protein
MSRTFSDVSSEIRMAGLKHAQLPGFKDAAIEKKAKEQVRKEYPGISEDNERFWKIVRTVYESMGGT